MHILLWLLLNNYLNLKTYLWMSRFLDRIGVINTNHEAAWQGFIRLFDWYYFGKEIKREGDYHNSREISLLIDLQWKRQQFSC